MTTGAKMAELIANPRPRFGPLTDLPGVGPARAALLAGLGVFDIADLLFVMPARLEEGRAAIRIADALAQKGHEVHVEGVVVKTSVQRFGRRSTVRVTIADASASITALFFNQPWLAKRFKVGETLALRGKIVDAQGPALASPKIGSEAKPLPAEGSVTPVHPSCAGVASEFVARLCRLAADKYAELLEDPIDVASLAECGLPCLSAAVRELHTPRSFDTFRAARRRLALESLLELQARLQSRRREARAGRALRAEVGDAHDAEIRARFPFELTAGQKRVAHELRADLARSQPMRRLLQGDVGSGKTALGVYAALCIAHGGGQSAFLAPTELLAEQHYDGLRGLLERAGLRAALLTGSLSAPNRRAVLAELESGRADIAFGTHALFSGDVEYARLALCVIDEQHRFGVAQRARLLDKGRDVHALLMTATPIPRTLALALYGDLDTSTLAERPPNRGPMSTRWVRGADKRKVEGFLEARVTAGERLYWVVPRIGGGDEELGGGITKTEVSAEARFERLQSSKLAAFGIELVHGRLPADERARRLARFRDGHVRTLVATTVIEVGVDVPEATVMVIEGAERLGLAQLHQLRGRVGRGPQESWCLLYGAPSASERFATLERTCDGFVIAEEDLRARGMGDLTGLRQAGLNAEGLAEIDADIDLFHAAQRLVAQDERVFAHYAALARSRAAVQVP